MNFYVNREDLSLEMSSGQIQGKCYMLERET
jgi:hypothetical protein